MKDKIYVVEEKIGFRDWKPLSTDIIRQGAISNIKLYRELSRIYRRNGKYRIRTYTPEVKKK